MLPAKRAHDVVDDVAQRKRLGNVGEWHESWQRLVPEDCIEQSIGNRRADILIINLAVEVQHSPISQSEVAERNADYARHGTTVLWIVDGHSCGASALSRSSGGASEEWLVVMRKPYFIKSFEKCNIVLLDIDGSVFALQPGECDTGTARVATRWTKDEVVEIIKSHERHHELLRPTLPSHQSSIRLRQCAYGTGKTYDVVHGTVTGTAGFEQYDVVLMLTKPHSAKEVFNHQMTQQLCSLQVPVLDKGDLNKAYWYKIEVNGRTRLVITATVDSFIYKLGEPDSSVMDQFEAICKTIATHGPSTGKNGHITFKGQKIQLNGQCLIIVDEATKLGVQYTDALGRLSFVCRADTLVVGDKMQSIEYEQNMLTALLDQQHPDYLHVSFDDEVNEIRRCGQILVAFIEAVAPRAKYNLKTPVASDDPGLNREHDGEFKVDVLDGDEASNVKKIMSQFKADVHANLFLPNDCLVVSPFVSRNTLLDEVRDEMHNFWRSTLEDVDFRARLESIADPERKRRAREYIRWYDDDYKKQPHRSLLATRHYSDAGRPVDTSTSTFFTRMVSIHASQGDDRRYCMTVGLSEKALKTYSHDINLRYDSLLCVALSRAKTKLVVYIDASYDDVWRRFEPFLTADAKSAVEPTFSVSCIVRLEHQSIALDPDLVRSIHDNVLPVVARTSAMPKPLLDYVHHYIRACSFNAVFFLRALEQTGQSGSQVFAKAGEIARATIVVVSKPSDYYGYLRARSNDLQHRKPLTKIPLLEYRDIGLADHVREAAERAKDFLSEWHRRNAQWHNIQNDTLAVIMIQYMLDYEQNGGHIETKLAAVYMVAKALKSRHANCDLTSFYASVHDARNCFDRLHNAFGSDGNWLVMHNVTHGRPDGGALPFSPSVRPNFVIEGVECVRTIHLRPQVNELNMPEMACTALCTRRIFEQPCTQQNKNERFVGKEIKTVFVDTSSGQDYTIPNDYVDAAVVDEQIIIGKIRTHYEVHHEAIDKFCAFHGNDEYRVRAAYETRKDARKSEYVSRAIYDALENGTAVRPMLDKRLAKELRHYARSAAPPCPPL